MSSKLERIKKLEGLLDNLYLSEQREDLQNKRDDIQESIILYQREYKRLKGRPYIP